MNAVIVEHSEQSTDVEQVAILCCLMLHFCCAVSTMANGMLCSPARQLTMYFTSLRAGHVVTCTNGLGSCILQCLL